MNSQEYGVQRWRLCHAPRTLGFGKVVQLEWIRNNGWDLPNWASALQFSKGERSLEWDERSWLGVQQVLAAIWLDLGRYGLIWLALDGF